MYVSNKHDFLSNLQLNCLINATLIAVAAAIVYNDFLKIFTVRMDLLQ